MPKAGGTKPALGSTVVQLYLLAERFRTFLYLILLLGMSAAVVHVVMLTARRLRAARERRSYSASRIAAATAAASASLV